MYLWLLLRRMRFSDCHRKRHKEQTEAHALKSLNAFRKEGAIMELQAGHSSRSLPALQSWLLFCQTQWCQGVAQQAGIQPGKWGRHRISWPEAPPSLPSLVLSLQSGTG